MKIHELTSDKEVAEVIAWHNANSEFVVLDTETTDKDPRKASLIDMQMSGLEPDSVVIFSGAFASSLLNLNVLQVWHNYKYDWHVLYRHGVDLRGKPFRDTMLMHHLVDENASHKLDDIVQELWNDSYKKVFWEKNESYSKAPREEAREYACRDILYTSRLFVRLSLAEIRDTLLQHVHRLAAALFDTEVAGIRIDLDYLSKMGTELKRSIYETKEDLYKLSGAAREQVELTLWSKAIEAVYTPRGNKWKSLPKPTLNFSSSTQVGQLLYDRMGFPEQRNRRTKQRTVDDGALESLSTKFPDSNILSKLRNLRTFEKMDSAFCTGILKVADGDRVFPSFNVNGTVTGRVAHSRPNIAQAPKDGEWVKLRGVFVPEPGNVLLELDFSMLEVVIAAHFSQDKNLLKIINEGASKHDITAEALGIPRSTGKTLNFAMQYQCSPYKVQQILCCSPVAAKTAYDKYWETYSGERAVIEQCKKLIDGGNPIISPWGRSRRFPKNLSEREREAAYREGYAALIQGTGSDCTSWAFYNTAEWLKETGLGRVWCTIHDSILLECKLGDVDAVSKKVVSFMEDSGKVINLTVPLKVAVSKPMERWGM